MSDTRGILETVLYAVNNGYWPVFCFQCGHDVTDVKPDKTGGIKCPYCPCYFRQAGEGDRGPCPVCGSGDWSCGH